MIENKKESYNYWDFMDDHEKNIIYINIIIIHYHEIYV